MELQQYWAVVRRRLWLIVVGILLCGIAGYLISRSIEPTYQATASVVVQDATTPIPGYGYSQPAVMAHAELIRKESVLLEVITELDLPYSPAELRRKIGTVTSVSSPLIKVTADDRDALMAQQIANTTVTVYIRQYRESVRAAAQEFLSEIQQQISKTSAQIDQLQAIEATLGLTPEEADELKSLQDDLESLKTQRTLWNTQVAEAVAAGGVSVGESAPVPIAPVSPRTLQNVAVACILGLVLTTGGVFLKEYLDRSVKSAEDVSVLTGLSTLGVIPKFNSNSKQRGGIVTEAYPRSSVAEAFRMLRTNLEFATLDKPSQTLMITAPGPAEGKTFVLANLAVTLAQTGQKVIAVDGDLRRSSIHEKFDLRNDMGFINLLSARQPDVRGYLQSSKVEGLKVLAAGPPTQNCADLLSSSRLPFLVEELKKQANVILFDSPPVLAVADAAILAAKVDGVVLVVNAGHTRPAALVEAAKILSKGNARVLGVVLNRMNRKESGSYCYYRGISDYYDEEDGRRSRKHRRSSSKKGLHASPKGL